MAGQSAGLVSVGTTPIPFPLNEIPRLLLARGYFHQGTRLLNTPSFHQTLPLKDPRE